MVQVSDGGYLTIVYVLPMCPTPEVVTWGLRLFVRQTDSSIERASPRSFPYITTPKRSDRSWRAASVSIGID